MDARLKFACLITLGLWLGGCAQPQPLAERLTEAPPFLVPSTAMIQKPNQTINPYQVLVYADEADFFIGRSEKAAFGDQLLSSFSAFTTYTVDAQSISTPGSFGYRYRYVLQQGVSSPTSP